MRRRVGGAVTALVIGLAGAAVAPAAQAGEPAVQAGEPTAPAGEPATLAAAPAAPTKTAATNPVIIWDRHAQTAIWDVGRQLPWEQGRTFAMVSGAVYDAVNAIGGKPYQPLLTAPPATGRESVDAAVATAAYRVLASVLPAQADRLREQYEQALAAIPDGTAETAGIAVGDRTAAAMIASRVDDGSFGDAEWVVGTEPGDWRPAPPAYAADGAWVADVRPFLIPDPSRFRSSGPYPLGGSAYARDFNEIKSLGEVDSTTRTADQTEAAIWWHDRNVTEWQIKRQLAETQRLSVLQTARMFAMVDVTLADTQISCFDDKRAWSFWRPVTAVHEAGTDGNPRTTADPDWTPLLITPPFPDHPSGHACATAARMATFRTYFGRDRIGFSAYSEASGTTRHFHSFSQAVEELNNARVWGGIHFRNADLQGRKLGEAVSAYVTARHFQKLRS
ncbi:vanadium-dependent haloperoxidase [Actinoplanes sp. NPDC049802]|uniref:vanadium-dependent haloperoxidase n=1 Tax=Actinoplanes sp. NPDC049802 TaxID=3154742 RepID=UPI0034110704